MKKEPFEKKRANRCEKSYIDVKEDREFLWHAQTGKSTFTGNDRFCFGILRSKRVKPSKL